MALIAAVGFHVAPGEYRMRRGAQLAAVAQAAFRRAYRLALAIGLILAYFLICQFVFHVRFLLLLPECGSMLIPMLYQCQAPYEKS